MDDSELVKIIESTAKRDSLDGQGRIILSDFRIDVEDPQLTAEHVLVAWRKFNPNFPIRQASENVILIEFTPRPSAKDRYLEIKFEEEGEE